MLRAEVLESRLFEMPDDARVWIYQAGEPLGDRDKSVILNELDVFLQDWKAHGKDLAASGDFLFDRFLIISADEDKMKASGCSIDASVRFVKEMEKKFQVEFFDRKAVAYMKGDKLFKASLNELEGLHKKGFITDETIVFNNLVGTISELKSDWMIPLGKSWHKQFCY